MAYSYPNINGYYVMLKKELNRPPLNKTPKGYSKCSTAICKYIVKYPDTTCAACNSKK